MSWWLLVLIAGAMALAVYGLFRWAAGDRGIDEEIGREQFRAEQNWRGGHRAGEPPANARERLQNVR